MPVAAQGEASNRWMCSNGHDGQQMAKPPKLRSPSSCRQLGALPLMQMHIFTSTNRLFCFHTSRAQGCCVTDLMTMHTYVDKFSTNVLHLSHTSFPPQVIFLFPHPGPSCDQFWILKQICKTTALLPKLSALHWKPNYSAKPCT